MPMRTHGGSRTDARPGNPGVLMKFVYSHAAAFVMFAAFLVGTCGAKWS
jgi:hypothetical protein